MTQQLTTISERDLARMRDQFDAFLRLAQSGVVKVRALDDVLAGIEARVCQTGVSEDAHAALVADLAPYVGPGAAPLVGLGADFTSRIEQIYTDGALHRTGLSYAEGQRLAREINEVLLPALDARPVIDTTAVTVE